VVTIQDIPGNMPLKAKKNEVVMKHAEDGPDRPRYMRIVDMNRKRPRVAAKGKYPDTTTHAHARAGTSKAKNRAEAP
jgi:hypothetical protein